MILDAEAKLVALLAMLAENEVVEFKEAKYGYDFTKLGKYFSALCNEANPSSEGLTLEDCRALNRTTRIAVFSR